MNVSFRHSSTFVQLFRLAVAVTLLVSLGLNRAVASNSLVTANATATTRQQTTFPPQSQDVKSASNQAIAGGDPGAAHAGGTSSGDLPSGTLTVSTHACSQLLLSDPGFTTGDGGSGTIVADGYFTLYSPTLPAGTPVTINFTVQMSASVQVTWSSGSDYSQYGFSSVDGEFQINNYPIDVSGHKDMREDGQNGITHSTTGLADGTKLTNNIYFGLVGHIVEVLVTLKAESTDSSLNGQTTDANAQAALAWGWDSTNDVQLISTDGYVAPPSSNVNSNYVHSVTPEPIFPGPIPTLTIKAADTNYLLAWSSASSGFNLYQNTNLPAANWLRVTNPASVVGTNVQVIIPGTGLGKTFYRLKFP